jgi:hypothetical protein
MARGNSTRRNLAPEDISKLIRGDKTALQANAAKGGNAPAGQQTPAANQTPVPANQPLNPTQSEDILKMFQEDEAKAAAFKSYLQGLQDKAEFDSEQEAEAAREAAFKAWVAGQRSLAEAAAMASPKNAKKNAKKKKGEEGEEKGEKEGKKETPWYLRSGRGFAGLFFGHGGKGGINEVSILSEGAAAQQEEIINNLRKKVGVRGAPAPVVAPPPSK